VRGFPADLCPQEQARRHLSRRAGKPVREFLWASRRKSMAGHSRQHRRGDSAPAGELAGGTAVTEGPWPPWHCLSHCLPHCRSHCRPTAFTTASRMGGVCGRVSTGGRPAPSPNPFPSPAISYLMSYLPSPVSCLLSPISHLPSSHFISHIPPFSLSPFLPFSLSHYTSPH
jgi:hypothetical protein